MRCLACNVRLSEGEDARRFADSGERVELCNNCAVWINLPMVGGDDILSVDEIEDEEMEEYTEEFSEEEYES